MMLLRRLTKTVNYSSKTSWRYVSFVCIKIKQHFSVPFKRLFWEGSQAGVDTLEGPGVSSFTKIRSGLEPLRLGGYSNFKLAEWKAIAIIPRAPRSSQNQRHVELIDISEGSKTVNALKTDELPSFVNPDQDLCLVVKRITESDSWKRNRKIEHREKEG